MSKPVDRLQLEVCEQHGVEAAAPEEMVAVATSTIGRSPVHGTRVQLPQDGTVSWFFHGGESSDAEDFYQPVCAEHLPTLLPLVVKYLHLPPGMRFIVDDKGFEDVWRDA